MAIRNYSNTTNAATLAGPVGATDTSVTLSGLANPPAVPFTAEIDRGTPAEEAVLVTAVSGQTVTVTRGFDQTAAQAHAAQATFEHAVLAVDFREANAHVNTAGGVHGVAGALVGTTDAQTLTNKTLTAPALSSPTVTGTATLATATVTGTLTAATATVTGTLTASGGLTVPAGKKATLTDAPAASTDAVNKSYVDGLVAGATTASSTPTAATLVKRDAAGRAQFADPAASADAATKSYVDTKVAGIPPIFVQSAAPASAPDGALWFQTS